MIISTGHQRLSGMWLFYRAAEMALLFALFLTIITGQAFGGPVTDTGQTTCYDESGNVAPCPLSGSNLYGQDGNYAINPPSYTKLDPQGDDLADDAPSWVMVRDNVTRLIWEMKTDDGSIHDKDNTYTWYDSNAATNGGNAGTPGEGTDTEDFINDLNAAEFGGHRDWRMPTLKELRSIVDYGGYNPAINNNYFVNEEASIHTMASNYWSSTTDPGGNDHAWVMSFDYGYVSGVYKSDYGCARAVRSGQ